MKFSPGECNIICSNLAKSRTFYEDLLGFTFVEEDSGAIRLSLGSRFFLLLPVASKKKSESPYCTQPEISFDLKVQDVKAGYEYLKNKGVVIVQELDNEESWFVIADPDDNHLEIIQDNIKE